jgi:hypothetical protein
MRPTDVAPPSAPTESTPDAAEDWRIGSSRQLSRLLGGHCISCAFWQPDRGDKGACSAIPLTKNNPMIVVPAGEVRTDAAFGCHLFAEVAPALFVDPVDGETPAAFGREEAALMERTDLALKLGLLPGPPEDFTGGGPGIERERERRDVRRAGKRTA